MKLAGCTSVALPGVRQRLALLQAREVFGERRRMWVRCISVHNWCVVGVCGTLMPRLFLDTTYFSPRRTFIISDLHVRYNRTVTKSNIMLTQKSLD